MITNTDQFGDMRLEDVEEWEGLEPDNERAISPLGRFQPNEFRQFDQDFDNEVDWDDEDRYEDDEEEYEEYSEPDLYWGDYV